MEPARPRFSLVIPSFNEEKYLPRLLDSVDRARASYGPGAANIEVIVADNGSTDRTAEIASARGCRVARVEKRVIAASRNGGASIARGEILCFTDADGQIHPRTFDEIDAALLSGRVVGGATGVTMERWSVGVAVTFALLVPFVWLTGFDTGVVFCRREDFETIGGYDERLRLAEDVKFLFELRRLGRKRGERLARVTSAKGVASTRKFDDHGDWHYFTVMAKALPTLLGRASAVEWIERYWYKPNR
jgi:glycosyltransferase involved in cell wall biosynthesis